MIRYDNGFNCKTCGYPSDICKCSEDTELPEIIKCNGKEKHPLLNPDSPHYRMFDDTEAIEQLEKIMTREELMGWAKGNVYRYRFRIGNKDNVEKEAAKIATYEAYYKYLKGTNI